MRYIISIFIFLFSLMSAVNVFATENWLSQDFLTAAHKSAIFKKIKNPPFFQLTFDDAKHTVTYSNGFENVIVPIEKKQNETKSFVY